MPIKLIAIGEKMPTWVNNIVNDYQRRTPTAWRWQMQAVAAQKRDRQSVKNILELEGRALLKHADKCDFIIALDRLGTRLSTEMLTESTQDWHNNSLTVGIIIGGPEGLCSDVINQSQKVWSLSDLTLPHPLVRVIMAEQFYRAWSMLNNHPYHRGT